MKKLFLSAGDWSGDVHCGKLVAELLSRHPDWQIGALGSRNTHQAGAQLIGDTGGLGVIGFVSALGVVPRTLRLKNAALKWIDREKPDVAVLCDWGGFNTRILPALRKRKIPVLYYFPPRSWQKTGEGGLQIAAQVQKIATPFEWSATRLQSAGGDATWVGHPILETVRELSPRELLRREFGLSDGEKLLTILPGSRALELKYIAPHLAGAVALLRRESQFKNLKFAVAASDETGAAKLRAIFGPDALVVVGKTLELLSACDLALVKSGTSTLEAAAVNAPQIVVYEVPSIVHLQIKATGLRQKVPFVSMPNIIAGKAVCPELLGESCRAGTIFETARTLLEDNARAAQMREEYRAIREALGETLPYTATEKTADLVEATLREHGELL